MMRFKSGDRIVIVDRSCLNIDIPLGAKGVIDFQDEGMYVVDVTHNGKEYSQYIDDDQMELDIPILTASELLEVQQAANEIFSISCSTKSETG